VGGFLTRLFHWEHGRAQRPVEEPRSSLPGERAVRKLSSKTPREEGKRQRNLRAALYRCRSRTAWLLKRNRSRRGPPRAPRPSGPSGAMGSPGPRASRLLHGAGAIAAAAAATPSPSEGRGSGVLAATTRSWLVPAKGTGPGSRQQPTPQTAFPGLWQEEPHSNPRREDGGTQAAAREATQASPRRCSPSLHLQTPSRYAPGKPTGPQPAFTPRRSSHVCVSRQA